MTPSAGPGLTPRARMPQVVAPGPTPRGFTPVTNPGVVQRPGMPAMQPSSPTQSAAPQPAVTLPAPPPTIQSADTIKVPRMIQNLPFYYCALNFLY